MKNSGNIAIILINSILRLRAEEEGKMGNLIEELSKLESQKKYSIVLNGVGCFIFLTKEQLNIENIKEEYEHLFYFKIIKKKKVDDKYFVLEFSGITKLKQKDIVQFLLDLMSYKSEGFQPQFLTVGIRKEIHHPGSLIAVKKKKYANGEIGQTSFKNLKKGVEVAIIGDYFFQSYTDYQTTLQGLVDIWINE